MSQGWLASQRRAVGSDALGGARARRANPTHVSPGAAVWRTRRAEQPLRLRGTVDTTGRTWRGGHAGHGVDSRRRRLSAGECRSRCRDAGRRSRVSRVTGTTVPTGRSSPPGQTPGHGSSMQSRREPRASSCRAKCADPPSAGLGVGAAHPAARAPTAKPAASPWKCSAPARSPERPPEALEPADPLRPGKRGRGPGVSLDGGL